MGVEQKLQSLELPDYLEKKLENFKYDKNGDFPIKFQTNKILCRNL